MAAEARAALAATWRGLYYLFKPVHFSIAVYGEEAATRLATECVSRMGLYSARWCGSGGHIYEHNDAEYKANPDYVELCVLVFGNGV